MDELKKEIVLKKKEANQANQDPSICTKTMRNINTKY